MKNIIFRLTFLAVFSLLITSCNKEDYTDHSTTVFVKPSATFTSVSGAAISVDETSIDPDNGKTYTFTGTLSSPSIVDTYIDLSKVGGTLSADEFSTVKIYIPAQSLTGTGSITIFRTSDFENVETLQIKANALGHSENVTGSSAVYTITVNSDYHAVDASFDWSGSYTYTYSGGDTETINFKNIDLDFYIYDSDFNDLGIYDAATGSSPESFEAPMLVNGTYYITAYVWVNPYETYVPAQALPIRVHWEQQNIGHGDFIYGGFTTAIGAGNEEIIAELTVLNGVYTIAPY